MGILLEPIGATILAYFILDEPILWTQILGGTIILAGLMIFLKDEQKSKVQKRSSLHIKAVSRTRLTAFI